MQFIPLLMLALNLPINHAIGLSLAIVGFSAIVGVITRAWGNTMVWRPAIVFSLGGMASAPIGRYFGAQVPDHWLMLGFALLAILIATKTWFNTTTGRKAATTSAETISSENLWPLIIAGIGAGLLSGFFGVGG